MEEENTQEKSILCENLISIYIFKFSSFKSTREVNVSN